MEKFMSEIEHPLLDLFQLEELAEKISVQTKNFSTIQHIDHWKLLLGLYREEIVITKGKSWSGIQAKPLGNLVKVKSNTGRCLAHLRNLGFVKSQRGLYTSTREVFYSLTEEGRLFVEEIVQRSESMIKFARADIIAGELPRVSGVLDRYNILDGALAYLHNFYPEDADEFPDLYNLSQTLDLRPYEIMNVLSNYCLWREDSLTKNKTALFRINPGKPRIKRYAFNCNDLFVCNSLCRICHNTILDLTPVGGEMCKSLSKTPQRMNFRIRQTSIDKFFTFSLIISFSLLSFATIFNETLLESGLYFLVFIFIVNSLTFWVLRTKNIRLQFEEED